MATRYGHCESIKERGNFFCYKVLGVFKIRTRLLDAHESAPDTRVRPPTFPPKTSCLSCLVLYTPRAGRVCIRTAALLARCPPVPLPQTWTCCAMQIVTRVPLSLYLGPRLVNVVSLRKRPNSLNLQHKLSPKKTMQRRCLRVATAPSTCQRASFPLGAFWSRRSWRELARLRCAAGKQRWLKPHHSRQRGSTRVNQIHPRAC
jgi:hypothetical protein